MSLVEVLVGAGIFVVSASCSLQVWSGTASWSQRSQRQRQEMQQLEAGLLAVQALLQQRAGEPLALDCPRALAALADQLPAGSSSASGDGRLLVALQGAEGGRRQRWFDPAAYGLCGVEPAMAASEPPADLSVLVDPVDSPPAALTDPAVTEPAAAGTVDPLGLPDPLDTAEASPVAQPELEPSAPGEPTSDGP